MKKAQIFPSWLAREKARNLENLKLVDEEYSQNWKSFADCAAANAKRVLVLLRDAASPVSQDPEGWRICQVRCQNYLRQIVRLHQNRWQVRSYIESRKMRTNNFLRSIAETFFTIRAYSETSRMTKYLSLERQKEYPPIHTWSLASKRAYEKINYTDKETKTSSPWAACFKRINLLNLHFHRTQEWNMAFEGRIKPGISFDTSSIGNDWTGQTEE